MMTDVILVPPPVQSIEITPPAAPAVVVQPLGAQGPPGPAGSAFVHTQSAPAAIWIINHNAGRLVAVTLLSVGGVEIHADVTNVSLNQVRVDFLQPTAGQAVCT